MTRVVGLGGGIGASRLWPVLAALEDVELTLVVNTADDLWIHGVRVCPDLDTTLYALSGRQDRERGWGMQGETWRCMDMLRDLGTDVWFNLGDLDLAVHLRRTARLRHGVTLTRITAEFAADLGVIPSVLPMTDDEVATTVLTRSEGRLHYEEFLVRYGAALDVLAVGYDGIETARPAPGVLEAIAAAEVIVLGPSNPVASIGPILAIPGIRAALTESPASVIAVSPIVSGTPIMDPGERRRATCRASLMRTCGIRPDPAGVASMYADLSASFVLDRADAYFLPAIQTAGIQVGLAATLLHTGVQPDDLLDLILGFPAAMSKTG